VEIRTRRDLGLRGLPRTSRGPFADRCWRPKPVALTVRPHERTLPVGTAKHLVPDPRPFAAVAGLPIPRRSPARQTVSVTPIDRLRLRAHPLGWRALRGDVGLPVGFLEPNMSARGHRTPIPSPSRATELPPSRRATGRARSPTPMPLHHLGARSREGGRDAPCCSPPSSRRTCTGAPGCRSRNRWANNCVGDGWRG
jgi:hypothetical protein